MFRQKINIWYVLDLWSFVAIKIPENGTLVPKHVRFDSYHEVCFMICVLLYFT